MYLWLLEERAKLRLLSPVYQPSTSAAPSQDGLHLSRRAASRISHAGIVQVACKPIQYCTGSPSASLVVALREKAQCAERNRSKHRRLPDMIV